MNTDTQCHTPYGNFELKRYPGRGDESLRAWNTADLLLLDEACRLGVARGEALVVNDEHGALSVALAPRCLWTDSALSAIALRRNLQANAQAGLAVTWSTEIPPEPCTTVVMRVPKQLSYFEYQLGELSELLTPGSTVLAGGMDKHLTPKVAELLEYYIGPARRHRGARKARIFTAQRDSRRVDRPQQWAAYFCREIGAELKSLPNVFSRERLDGGTRLLLKHLHALDPAPAGVIDLACGNGISGIAAVKAGLAANVVFVDESAMAIASARANVETALNDTNCMAAYHHGDGLMDFAGAAADLILCNPPFHMGHIVDDYAGRRLLGHCASRLSSGGQLCLVANRHLDYRRALRRHFKAVHRLAGDKRFTVWLAGSGPAARPPAR